MKQMTISNYDQIQRINYENKLCSEIIKKYKYKKITDIN